MAGLKLPWHTFVVACDGAKALLLQNHGDEIELDLQVFEAEDEHHKATHDLGTDRPGRVQQSATTGRSSTQETDLHAQQEADFLTRLAHQLAELVANGTIKHLVLVAPPKALGTLREKLDPHVKAVVMAELDKDLAHMPVYEIEKHISA
jgi:protein required for attachment to host cells